MPVALRASLDKEVRRSRLSRRDRVHFYLPCSNEYIEVKGYYSDNDKMKMQLVLKDNPGIKIYMISQYDYPLFKSGKLWLQENMIMKPERFQ